MRKKLLAPFLTLLLLVFGGCSTKEVFEPQHLSGDWQKEQSLPSAIHDKAYSVAQLDDGQIITKKGFAKLQLPQHHRAVSFSENSIVWTTIDGVVTVDSLESNETKTIDLKHTIATATLHKDILAVVFANNDIALYNVNTQEVLFKEPGGKALAIDMRAVDPIFMKDLVLFATLDGKVIIVSVPQKKRLRTVIVSSEAKFNNVIYLNFFQGKIVAATRTKLLAFAKEEKRVALDIRSVTHDEKMIYVATRQGEVIAFTPDLDLVQKVKFPFAHILGVIPYKQKLYLLEKEGYVIVVDKKSFEYEIYEADFDDGFSFLGEKLFYVDDTKIIIE